MIRLKEHLKHIFDEIVKEQNKPMNRGKLIMYNLLNHLIDLAAHCPEKKAVVFKGEYLTYRELCRRIAGMADDLVGEGITHGDRVCFSAVSKPEMVAAYMAIQACGAVAVFLDKNGTPENMAEICKEAGAKLLLTDKPMKEYAKECRVLSLRKLYQRAGEWKQDDGAALDVDLQKRMISPAEDELAELLFTTGTTGKPKGVMLTYKAVYHILTNTIEGIGIREDDILLLPLPLNHSFALRVLRAVLYRGATVVLQNGFTFAKEVENNVVNHGCNAMACVPASYEVMKSQMQDAFTRILGGMRFIEFSAGSLSIRQREEITTLLPKVQIYNTWGSSESGGAIFCNVREAVKSEERAGTLGKPLAGKVRVMITDSEGKEMDSNESHPGRMALQGDMQMAGYWNNEEMTAQMLRDGWLLTGDMAYLDADGYVFMLGRADDIINVGGEKVSPLEVENIAGRCEGVRECACIGVEDPDGIYGQIPVLFVAADSRYTEEGLRRFMAAKAERYKIPQKYVLVESIPRNRMQKVDRNRLKSLWEDRDAIELINPVVQNILSRRSIRKFTDQEIKRPVLDMLLKAGYHAPSGHNMQTWRFTVLTRQADIAELKELTRQTAEQNKVHFYGFENPKVIILISNDDRNADGCQDASCAAENIMLAAESYGIGSVWLNPLMTLRGKEPVKSLLDRYGIPAGHTVWAAVALGYPVSGGVSLQKKENVVFFVE